MPAFSWRGADGGVNGLVDRVILVIGGDLFDGLLFGLFKDDEMADDIEQGLFVEQAFDQGFQFRLVFGIDHAYAIRGFPLHEAGIIAGDGADFGKPAVADDQKGVGGEERGNELLVGLQLVIGGLHIGVFVGGVFQFDHHQGQAVDKEDNIRALVGIVFDDGELVDRQKFVVFRDGPNPSARPYRCGFTLADAEFDVHAVGQQAVEGFVVVQHG